MYNFPAKVIFMHGHLKSSDSGVKSLLPEKTAKICDATSFITKNDAWGDLDSASVWSCHSGKLFQPIRSPTLLFTGLMLINYSYLWDGRLFKVDANLKLGT